MITNASKPTTTIANSDKAAGFETWGSISTTWLNETRTWLETSTLIEGIERGSFLEANSNNTDIGTYSANWSSLEGYQIQAHSFVSSGGKLHSVAFPLQLDFNSTVGDYAYAVIYAHSGTYGVSSVPTGSPLATSDIISLGNMRVQSTGQWTTFYFSGTNQINLTSGTTYCIGYYLYVTPGQPTQVSTEVGTTAGEHSGNIAEYDGVSWTPYANFNLRFRLYMTSLLTNSSKP